MVKKYSKKTLKLKGGSDIDKEFRNACADGNLEKAKEILQKIPRKSIPNFISQFGEMPFNYACQNGRLNIVEWLLEVKPTIDISNKNEYPFRLACRHGHLELAKWLLSVKPTINISANNEDAFIWACDMGHLQIAQWLYNIPTLLGKPPINISAQNDNAFKYACKNGHLAVAQWLYSLNPFKYIIENCSVNSKKNQQMKGIIYSMNKSGNENALPPDVVDALNNFIPEE